MGGPRRSGFWGARQSDDPVPERVGIGEERASVLPPSSRIHGTVLDVETSEPVPDYLLRIECAGNSTDTWTDPAVSST